MTASVGAAVHMFLQTAPHTNTRTQHTQHITHTTHPLPLPPHKHTHQSDDSLLVRGRHALFYRSLLRHAGTDASSVFAELHSQSLFAAFAPRSVRVSLCCLPCLCASALLKVPWHHNMDSLEPSMHTLEVIQPLPPTCTQVPDRQARCRRRDHFRRQIVAGGLASQAEP